MPVCVLPDGASMSYADEGAGAPILLVHGWAAHGDFFRDLRQRLARSHRVLTPTLRGHPGVGQGSAPLTIETLAEDMLHFVDRLDLNGVSALGWSMGAMALWAAAPRLGPRLDRLVVEDMSPRLVNDAEWRFGLAGGYGASDVAVTINEIRADWPAYVSRFAPRMFAPGVRAERPELVDWAAAEMSKASSASMASLWASMAAQDFRGALAAITQPMLVIGGAESQVYPAGATRFVATASPNAEHVVISGAGHVPHLEAPDAFFHHVEAFVRTSRRPQLKSGGVIS